MSESSASVPKRADEPVLGKLKVGILSFLCTEVAFFGTLIVAYLRYTGTHTTGPTPDEVLRLPIVIVDSLFLLSSSGTVYLATRALRERRFGRCVGFLLVTMLLGALFLAGTGYEWTDLIVNGHLTPWTNLFGSRFFTLIGFHALHVTIGIVAMGICAILTARRRMPTGDSNGVEIVSWYWHFVDAVWVVIFTVVYLIGR